VPEAVLVNAYSDKAVDCVVRPRYLVSHFV